MNMAQIRKLIEETARCCDDFFLIQVGAHNGTVDDPLRHLIRSGRCSGILVEPVRYLFEELIKRYADSPRLIFENVAISERVERRTIYRIRENVKGLPDWADQLGSFYRHVLYSHCDSIPNIEDVLVTEEVECIPLATLLNRHHVNRIDLLHTDTEGADWLILRQLEELAVAPRIVLYEHKHLSEDDREAAAGFLEQRGYSLTRGRADTLAVHAETGTGTVVSSHHWASLDSATDEFSLGLVPAPGGIF